MLVAVRAFRWEVIWTVIPRLVLIAFTICQPLLVTRFLTYLQSPSEREDASVGWALVGAYALVYLGVAFTTGFYWHRNYKTLAMLRASLVTAIFKQTTVISVTALDNSAAVTLMGTDVDRVIRGLHQAHELWANVIQIAIATWLLDREIGIACLGPLVVAIGRLSRLVQFTTDNCRYCCHDGLAFRQDWHTSKAVGKGNTQTDWDYLQDARPHERCQNAGLV